MLKCEKLTEADGTIYNNIPRKVMTIPNMGIGPSELTIQKHNTRRLNPFYDNLHVNTFKERV